MTNNNDKLLNSVRSVGIIKPYFDVKTQNFLPPQLNILGTGFWVEGKVFITCAHVVISCLYGSVEQVGLLVVGGNKAQYLKASISILDIEHDLAVLQILNKEFHEEQQEKCLSISAQKESVGDEIRFAGYPLGNRLLNEEHTPIFSKGVVAHTSSSVNKTRKEIKISGSIEGGFSGSPVVDETNNVVGIISNHPQETKNIFNIISWEHIVKITSLENS
ncbi:MAG: serine protease [Patescibacteria group bacterium]